MILIRVLSYDFDIIIVTGRNDKWRKLTTEWLIKHDIPANTVYMRRDDDYRKAAEIKLDALVIHFGSLEKARERVLFCLDDTDSVVEAYRNAGFPCYQVRPGGY